MIETVAIIGANLAGGRAAEALRHSGYDGRVVLIGEESWRPYERPPLSKEVLWDRGRLPDNFFLHEEGWYEANRIDLRLGARAEAVDLAGGAVRLATGETIPADRILLTTGGRARILPLAGADAPNVHHLRTKDDADRLGLDLRPGAHIVVIGMGVIGAEVAASARKAGCEVTAIEPAPVPMIRTIGERFGGWLATYHASRGVRTHFGVGVSALHLDGAGLVRAVERSDGVRVDCDAVVVGIGIVPAVELAAQAGIALGNGVVVDRQCRTSHPNVFAAGDVAYQPNFFGGRVRLETYQNAADQAVAAAQAMLGREVDYLKPCWFWSDQYDLNIQVSGRIDDSLRVVLRGRLEDNEFSAFYIDEEVVGVLTVNRAVDMGVGKRMVERRLVVDDAMLQDPSVPLREFLKARPAAGSLQPGRAAEGASTVAPAPQPMPPPAT